MSQAHRQNHRKTYRIALVAMFAALTAVGAFIRVPFPGMSFTLQLFFALMAGLLLGGELGALSIFVYILLGLVGLPVFAGGGGPAYVLEPSFGYLLGMGAGAFAVGKMTAVSAREKELGLARGEKLGLARGEKLGLARVGGACLIGLLVVYLIGVPYQILISRFYLHNDLGVRVMLGNVLMFFLPCDLVKVALASVIGRRLIPVLREPA